ncbi:putative monooxygenase [Hypomontagnella monticulosa]|nr:putative monooxygenase [Hypomontagnella monticulosa]
MGSVVDSSLGKLQVIVVGAGLCGLSMAISVSLAGHQVSVYETHSGTHEFGAGLQSSPNGTRIYEKWGLAASLKSVATSPRVFQIQRFDGTILAQRKHYDVEVIGRYGYPLWTLHRVDLQAALLRRATELGVEITYSSNVVNVNYEGPSIELQNGSKRHGDLVVIADGVWSKLRSIVLGQQIDAQPTGDIAYRIVLDRLQIEDEEILMWMSEARVQVWVGPGAHAVAYSVRGGTQMNLVLLTTEELPGKESRVKGNVAELQLRFQGWDPLLTKVLGYVKEVDKWRLMHVPALPTWRSENGRVVLGGDCAHAILPYMAQGLNMALEDAATLGSLMGHVRTRDQLLKATTMYENLRTGRVSRLLEETKVVGNEFHLEFGETQKMRDAHLRESFNDHDWAYPQAQPWIWSYNVFDVVEKAYDDDSY